MEPAEIGAMFGGALVVLHIGGTWLREYRKHKTWSANGKDLKEIKGDVKEVKKEQGEQGKKMAVISQSVDDQKMHCHQTVNRISRSMENFNKELLQMAKNKGRK